jgi:hypothetical protein
MKSSWETGSDMRRSLPILRVAVKPDSLKPRHRRTARAVLAVYTRALRGFYRKRAKGSGHPDGRTATVTAIQRSSCAVAPQKCKRFASSLLNCKKCRTSCWHEECINELQPGEHRFTAS